MTKYKQGDLLYINLNPTKGHEEAGKRPCLIVSNDSYNKLGNTVIVVPITNKPKGLLSVSLPENCKLQGGILCQHVRAVDLSARKHNYVEYLPEQTLYKVLHIIQRLF